MSSGSPWFASPWNHSDGTSLLSSLTLLWRHRGLHYIIINSEEIELTRYQIWRQSRRLWLDARHRCKRPSSNLCGSYVGVSWCANGKWHLERRGRKGLWVTSFWFGVSKAYGWMILRKIWFILDTQGGWGSSNTLQADFLMILSKF